DELEQMSAAPFPTGSDCVLVTFEATEEMLCFQALGWERPAHVLDLRTEFKNLTNGSNPPFGNELLGVMGSMGIPSSCGGSKAFSRTPLRTAAQMQEARQEVLEYCEAEVRAIGLVFEGMRSRLDLDRALLRGSYAWPAAYSHALGIPVDKHLFELLRDNLQAFRTHLSESAEHDFGVYKNGSFSHERFTQYLSDQGVPAWPRSVTQERWKVDKDTFEAMALLHPQIEPLRQVQRVVAKVRALSMSVGEDGRNRASLRPFSSITGRNQPRSSESVIGLPSWLRGLVRPEPGKAVLYIDFAQQELAIAAALSGDEAMKTAYCSGDFYLSFAKKAAAVPEDATKATHALERERFKVVALGVLFGMSAQGIASRLGISVQQGEDLLNAHKRAFPRFWEWSNGLLDKTQMEGKLETLFGWELHWGQESKERTVKNFPMQATGAEMMRLAHDALVQAGIQVCAPIHDAFLIECEESQIQDVIQRSQEVLAWASGVVLDGFEVGSEVEVVRHGERWLQPNGQEMWQKATDFLLEHCGEEALYAA
ncbi:MAG: hypothetical protein KIG95_11585, partial [Comamonas sp.]|nr:hypothetical protein [Comamonas sp.]